MSEICSKPIIKAPEQRQRHWRCSGVFIAIYTLFWCFYCWLWTSKSQVGKLSLTFISFLIMGTLVFGKKYIYHPRNSSLQNYWNFIIWKIKLRKINQNLRGYNLVKINLQIRYALLFPTFRNLLYSQDI